MRRIVILGGGYAGLHAFGQIRRRLGAMIKRGDVSLALVAKDPYHTYHGWTGEVLSGRLSVGSTLTRLPTFLGGQYIEGEVLSVDLDERNVHFRTPDGVEGRLPYDQLLVATGSRDPFSRLPGLAEHGWCLKDTQDMQRLVEHLEHFTGKHIAVVGGGMAGAETASALAERFRRLGRDVTIEIITSGEMLFRQLHPRFVALAARGTKILEGQGILIRRGRRVHAITKFGPVSQDGELLPADLTVVAAGVEYTPLRGLERLKSTPTGRYVADEFLLASGHDTVWLAGDIAEVTRPGGVGPCPVDALWAMKQGDTAGENIARCVLGKPVSRFAFGGLGQAAGLGNWSGISELRGLKFQGWLAWLIRVSFFAWFMPRRSDGIVVLRLLLRSCARERIAAALKQVPLPHLQRGSVSTVSTPPPRG